MILRRFDRGSCQTDIKEDSRLKLLKWVACAWLLISITVAATGMLSRTRASDVAIVLGNTVDEDGIPAPSLAARLSRAKQCYEDRECKMIFVSGGTGLSGVNEATSMHAWLLRNGVPADKIVVDADGNNTWATARHASEWMRAHGHSSAMVVTQYFHVPRAMLAMKRFGVAEVSGGYPLFWQVRDVYSVLREAPAFVWYAVRPCG
ncbi:YdcF family protein [Paraburkholderia edwinii]|uniref:YdcF family protein n=1 Tax=Paraburkholderia edwinii TaxID=2861782 RepID=A0ABX8UQ23_9BURK|nr:YdcF family protein [Paraburkholderia edwinii]